MTFYSAGVKVSSFLCIFANEIVELTVLASPRTKTVCKVIVYFPEKTSWNDLKEDYFAKKRFYRSKYLLTDEFEFFYHLTKMVTVMN